MKPVLVVEDSPMVMKIIRHVLSQSHQITLDYAQTFAEAKALVESKTYFAAMVDLSLPDAPSGEVVDFTLQNKIPTIVLTSSFDEQKRKTMLDKGIVDYVTKEGRYSYELALLTIERLIKHEQTKVLVVDDSSTQRKMLIRLLKLQLFNICEASDGVEAIKVLLANPDIKMLITDFNMPKMDGFELTKNIRVKYEKSDLIVIGISSEEQSTLSAKFIKYGANDFIKKPFNHEEFFCRLNHNLDFLEMIEKIRDSAARDELTGIYSRQHFFKSGESMLKAKEGQQGLSLAVIGLDYFDKINHSYGNDKGDLVLCWYARLLEQTLDRFFVARLHGDQFVCLMSGLKNEKACTYIDGVRNILANEVFEHNDVRLTLSFSAGVSNNISEGFDGLVKSALENMQRAKEAGGDVVFGD